jgi:hypothetical protein
VSIEFCGFAGWEISLPTIRSFSTHEISFLKEIVLFRTSGRMESTHVHGWFFQNRLRQIATFHNFFMKKLREKKETLCGQGRRKKKGLGDQEP